MQDSSSPRRPNVEFTRHRMPDEKRPFVSFSGDAGEWAFRQTATLEVPSLLALLAASNGAYCDLMVDIRSGFFPLHRDTVWDVTISIGDQVVGTQKFWKQYAAHQTIIPVARFFSEKTVVRIDARPACEAAGALEAPEFAIEVILTDKSHIWDDLEKRSIWLFSTARSGSTWLANDIIGWRHRARLVDESGLGRMFAPIEWDAERFFDINHADAPGAAGSDADSDLHFGRSAASPPFERAFRDLRREQQLLNHMNFDLFHRLLRDCALEQVVNEWGVRHYRHLVFKMPNDSHAADYIMHAFPQSHMIFLMRDGRDVLRSRFSPFASKRLASTKNRSLRMYAVAFYSHFWNFEVDVIRAAFETQDPERRYCLRYEDIRREPEHHIAKLLAAIGMPVSPDELDQLVADVTLENMPIETRGPDKPRQDGKVGGYRAAFSDEEVDLMNAIMGKNLRYFGYQVDSRQSVASMSTGPRMMAEA